MDSTTLSTLSDELILAIARHATSQAAARLSQTCQHLCAVVADQSLWKVYTMRDFGLNADIEEMMASGIEPRELNWRTYYSRCSRRRLATGRGFEQLLLRDQQRWPSLARLVDLSGTDCSQTLAHDAYASFRMADGLARRFWAARTISSARKRWAIDRWTKHPEFPAIYHIALAAGFDAFMPNCQIQIEGQISAIMHACLERILSHLTLEQKLITIVDLLRRHNYVGAANGAGLNDNFLSHALFSNIDSRSASPLLSNVILSAVCLKLGIFTAVCSFNSQVFTGVFRSIPKTGSEAEERTKPHWIAEFYIDLSRDNSIISYDDVLARYSESSGNTDIALAHRALLPYSSHQFLVHMCHNIASSIQAEEAGILAPDARYSRLKAREAITWCRLVTIATRQELINPLSDIMTENPEDVELLLHVSKMPEWAFDDPTKKNAGRTIVQAGERLDVFEMLALGCKEQRGDRPAAKNRTRAIAYNVGDVFRHKRYGYKAVIVGWEHKLGEHEVGFGELSAGLGQPLYRAVVEDESIRLVAQENISLVREAVSAAILPLLGRYFKRFDAAEYRFVHNMPDEYPDDS